MATSASLRLALAVAVIAAACSLVAGAGAARTGADRSPTVTAGGIAFPRTYHIFGTDRNLGALARYDMVVGYAYWNIRALRKRNPRGIFLLNPGLQPRNARDYQGLSVTYGSVHRWRGGRDKIGGGPKLGMIRPFDPYWDELHNADGSRAVANATWPTRGWNLADPTGKGTADLVAKVIAHASKRGGLYAKGWDGIHSDNWIYRIGVAWFYGSELDTDRDGRVDDYDTLRRDWAAGLTRVGLRLRSYLPGKLVGGNGNWNVRANVTGSDFLQYLTTHDDYLRSANYTLLEALEQYGSRADDVVRAAREWLEFGDSRGPARHFAILHELDHARDFQALRWGFSLSTIAGAHYGAYVDSHDDRLWFDEYDGGQLVRRRHWLGKPIANPTRAPNGVWRRDFKNGVVLSNPTSSPQTVRFETTLWRLKGAQDPAVNTGGPVTEVTVPARDGLFLLRRPDGATPTPAGG